MLVLKRHHWFFSLDLLFLSIEPPHFLTLTILPPQILGRGAECETESEEHKGANGEREGIFIWKELFHEFDR